MSWRGEDWLRVPGKLPTFASVPSASIYFSSGHRPIPQAYMGSADSKGGHLYLSVICRSFDQTIKSIFLGVCEVKPANRTCKGWSYRIMSSCKRSRRLNNHVTTPSTAR